MKKRNYKLNPPPGSVVRVKLAPLETMLSIEPTLNTTENEVVVVVVIFILLFCCCCCCCYFYFFILFVVVVVVVVVILFDLERGKV